MAALAFALLLVGVGGAILRPWRVPIWLPPLAAAATGVVLGAVHLAEARRALHPLYGPLAFLLAAVPLAVLLDGLGFFEAIAARLSGGRRAPLALWVLAALVTTVLNLDAAIVLLTPLYIRVARRIGLAPAALAFQTVLLSSLASSALPVSNLTNLIAASQLHLGALTFVTHLALPSLAAATVGWLLYRRAFRLEPAAGEPGPVPPVRPIVIGGAVVAGLLVAFLAGVAPWQAALGATAVLAAVTRRLPLRSVPWGMAIVAGSLAVLAASAVSGSEAASLLSGTTPVAMARSLGIAAGGANVGNNLPALLVALRLLGPRPGVRLWPVLLGVNAGPVLLVTGSLANLLWLDTVGRMGVPVSAGEFTRVGLRVGVPALLAAGVVLLIALR